MKETLRELLEKVWTRDSGIDQRMVEHCLKSSNYIDMGEFYLDLGQSKPTITKDLYFADTDYSTGEYRSAPDNTWKLFKSYNMRMNSNQKWLDELKDHDIIFKTQYSRHIGGELMTWANDNYNYRKDEGDITATPEQKEIVINALIESDKKYLTRLERYYKRYADKVWTHTYWAER
jgi:hypothetical protein